jgi:ferritin
MASVVEALVVVTFVVEAFAAVEFVETYVVEEVAAEASWATVVEVVDFEGQFVAVVIAMAVEGTC